MNVVSYQPGSLGDVSECKGELYFNRITNHVYIDIDSMFYNEFKIIESFVGQENDTVFMMKSALNPADTLTYGFIARDRQRVFFWNASNTQEPVILFRKEGDKDPYHRN
jgi:hypothetical protein